MKKSRLSGGSSKSYERRRLRWKWKTCLSARVLQVFFGGRDVQVSHVQAGARHKLPTLRTNPTLSGYGLTGVHSFILQEELVRFRQGDPAMKVISNLMVGKDQGHFIPSLHGS